MESSDGKIIYQIFVRNHTPEGTIKGVIKDLNRIKDLGVDIIYLMPIHEIGRVNRKGKYGSPYAIKDYITISKDLGTFSDLSLLIRETHKRGMKIIMDMVFDHTSPDSVLTYNHIEYYYIEDGMPVNRIGDWDDVIDLDVERKDVQDYLIGILRTYYQLGVDGFRFDVASLLPLEFFARARIALGEDVLFFAEDIDDGFKRYLRKIGRHYEEDEDLVPTFDLLYNYNYFPKINRFIKEKNPEPLRDAIRIINKESTVHPEILRSNCLENHDNDRIASQLNILELINMLTMFISLRGCAFLYAGEEYGLKHKPELFEKDPIEWSLKSKTIYEYVKEIIELKKEFGPIETQYIEEIGNLCVFKLTIKNQEKERVFLVNLNEDPILIEKILKESYDEVLNHVLKDKIDDGEVILSEPLIFTFHSDEERS